ncbi:hypothetical protein TREMEDRAFT_32149 [Tremella mesenterica DSM 1558]|uniref:uncharacterized protein n=1 Tax=Tremella mesenterica (strain ATCC 24925 / CBS 8224 / DSM 1558 / NBRC 9311 / NRRL Y-6157 / RJB 2259-6 / UBC 559-6) TaxID=578456 RepID=UPI0003F491BF|nr:uncharacterized protein TREMEDRAFT_32149 [Tremella mesenterica DSM 1558]EIW68398.1 hypothetical protein TREMEDRAFT_32149 [Tremella mesenterica DSM 1558]
MTEGNSDKPNGHVNGNVSKTKPASRTASKATPTLFGKGTSEPPAKRGRVAELKGETTKLRRKSSLSTAQINEVPPIPRESQYHILILSRADSTAISNPHKALFIFGTGDMGQFGLGPDELDEISRPKLHTWFEEQIEDGHLARSGSSGGGLETVACGGMHTLAIDEAGRVRSWGINDNAALGRITTDVKDPNDPESVIPNEDLETYPFVVESLEKEGFRAVQVAAGDSVSVAVSDKGELRAWGSFRSNDGILGFDGVPNHSPFQYHPISLPSLAKIKITSVSCGADHVLALAITGHVYVWGNGQQNQLGRRIIERRKLNGLEPERLGLRGIVHVSAGMYHSFAVGTDGTVWAWGLNTFHQTGISSQKGGEEEMINQPTIVDALSPNNLGGAKVVSISGGEHHSLFLLSNGDVLGCGRCDANELGLGEDHPAQEGLKERKEERQREREEKVMEKQKKLEKVKEGDESAKELAEEELAEAQASLRVPMGEYVPEPVKILFPPIPESYEVVPPFPSWSESSNNPISVISAGTRHNLAVSESGHVYAWGFGNQAQLGLGADVEQAIVPTLVRSKQLRPYKTVGASAGGQHCVLLAQKVE